MMKVPSSSVWKSYPTLKKILKSIKLGLTKPSRQRTSVIFLVFIILVLLFPKCLMVDKRKDGTLLPRYEPNVPSRSFVLSEILQFVRQKQSAEDSEHQILEPITTRYIDLAHAEPRVYPIKYLKGHRNGSIYPPGFRAGGGLNRTMLDVGANSGDVYSLYGAINGYTVLSFEPSPSLLSRFAKTMLKHEVLLTVVNTTSGYPLSIKTELELTSLVQTRARFTNPPNRLDHLVTGRARDPHPRVYLFPIAVSNKAGISRFHEYNCTSTSKCGKNNFLISNTDEQSGLTVPTFRLDDINLPVDYSSIWFLKIDVEGHETMVLQGAKKLLQKGNIQYIAVEFSSNKRIGTEWGVQLLNELFSSGFVCFHLRGFGVCHKENIRIASFECNFPFSLSADDSPTFLTYTKVFEFSGEKKRKMSDLLCSRRPGTYHRES